jgi:hypothetical protein
MHLCAGPVHRALDNDAELRTNLHAGRSCLYAGKELSLRRGARSDDHAPVRRAAELRLTTGMSENANLAAPWPTGHTSAIQTRRDVRSPDTTDPALSTS